MKKKIMALLTILVLMIIAVCSCTNKEENNEESVQNEHAVEESSVGTIQNEKVMEVELVESIPEVKPEGTVFNWAFFTKDKGKLDKEVIQQVNQRLEDLGIEGRVQIHFMNMDGYVTPETLEAAYQLLEGKLDFVSMSPSLVGLYKEDWKSEFINLKNELEKINNLYQKVPEIIWQSNQIAEGIYTFSNAKTVESFGYMFNEEISDKVGIETLSKLMEAEGLEDESIWEEIHEKKGDEITVLTGFSAGQNVTANDPYGRRSVSGLVSWYDELYFESITDDIKYNYVTGEVEWMGESETYQQLLEKIIEFYEKGYVHEGGMYVGMNENLNRKLGKTMKMIGGKAILTQFDERDRLYIPKSKKQYITRKDEWEYVYSCVYKKAQKGWEKILDAVGSDDEITLLLNYGVAEKDYIKLSDDVIRIKGEGGYDITVSGELFTYENSLYQSYNDEGDMFSLLEDLYETAELSPMGDFIFNPVPVQMQFKKCNQAAFMMAKLSIVQPVRIEDEDSVYYERPENVVGKIKEHWKNYLFAMRQTPINEVVEEANQQLADWRKDS